MVNFDEVMVERRILEMKAIIVVYLDLVQRLYSSYFSNYFSHPNMFGTRNFCVFLIHISLLLGQFVGQNSWIKSVAGDVTSLCTASSLILELCR